MEAALGHHPELDEIEAAEISELPPTRRCLRCNDGREANGWDCEYCGGEGIIAL